MEKQNNNSRINITPLLEQVLGVSQINSKKELQELIKLLKGVPDERLNPRNLAELMEKINKKKNG